MGGENVQENQIVLFQIDDQEYAIDISMGLV